MPNKPSEYFSDGLFIYMKIMSHFINGFLISAGLIMAIGAQNALVLKQGLLRQHVWPVVLLCWLCDGVLMTLGVFGLSALLSGSPKLSGILALAGGLFLLAYGTMSAKRAWQGGNYLTVNTENHLPPSVLKIAATTLALTLLNPHVYIDTIVLIGGSTAHLDQTAKPFFLAGAISASGLWFGGLGFGSRLMLPLFRREQVWQLLDGVIALVMFYLAFGLLKQTVNIFIM